MDAICRDCLSHPVVGHVCPHCRSPRLLAHSELFALTIAHVDCDAFFASVEKRDRPELADRPVIVGGGVRGVVTTACYIARMSGVRSAMPMFKAVKLCPDAVIVKPEFAKYTEAARRIRAMMLDLTPLVQPLSIDEAALDLSGTEALHGVPPAVVLAGLAQRIEREVGVTVSVGLAANRLLAKLAAGRDKPRGFAVLGTEAAGLLATEPVALLPGVGPAQERRLLTLGLTRIGQLQALTDQQARRLLGDDGPSLVARARCQDARAVDPVRDTKSISAETTFDGDVTETAALEAYLWRLTERLAARLRATDFAAAGVTLKLKTTRFAQRTRATRLRQPTTLPDTLFDAARALLAREVDGTAFRLIGIGAAPLVSASSADHPDLADPDAPRRVARQEAIDAIRDKFGPTMIGKGRGLKK